MALSTEVINGGNILLGYYDPNETPTPTLRPVAYGTSHSIELTMETRETSNKTVGKWRNISPSRLQFTVNGEGMSAYDGKGGVALKKLMVNRCKLQFFSYPKPGAEGDFQAGIGCNDTPDPAQGSDLFEIQFGDVYITSVSEDFQDEDNVIFSVTMEGAGELQFDTWANHKAKLGS